MDERKLPLAYARAIYDTALSAWVRDLSTFYQNLRIDSALRARLDDENLSFEAKQTLVDRALPTNVSQEVRNFAYTLLRDDKLVLLEEIITELKRFAVHGLNVIVAEVTTAVPLQEEEKSALVAKLTAKYGAGLDVVWRVDTGIIGGVVVRVGDEVTDNSVASRLQHLGVSLKGQS